MGITKSDPIGESSACSWKSGEARWIRMAVRLVLVFFGARSGTGFYQLIHDATQPFYRPFEGIFATTTFNGWHLEWPILVAMLAYALLHGIIRAVLSLLTR